MRSATRRQSSLDKTKRSSPKKSPRPRPPERNAPSSSRSSSSNQSRNPSRRPSPPRRQVASASRSSSERGPSKRNRAPSGEEKKMARKKKSRVVRAVPSSEEVTPKKRKPQIDTVVVHTTREHTRNASGAALADKAGSTIVPVLGGLAGGTAAVIATQKFNAHPGLVAAGAAA